METPQTASNISAVKHCVSELLGQDNSGHDMSHVNRVLRLSLKFAEPENVDKDLIALVALLHDVDDYKLFGEECAKNLTNAKKIMQSCGINPELQAEVGRSIREIGYGKRLDGKTPTTLAGKIVSDADMCDAIGVNGILRTQMFGIQNGRPFFNRDILPVEELNSDTYNKNFSQSSGVCHYFEKVLRLKDLMLTEAGRREAASRHQFTVEFLRHLFEEENAPEWLDRLREYED